MSIGLLEISIKVKEIITTDIEIAELQLNYIILSNFCFTFPNEIQDHG